MRGVNGAEHYFILRVPRDVAHRNHRGVGEVFGCVLATVRDGEMIVGSPLLYQVCNDG
ncbi:hypothetical protein GCM10027157_11350 [Corynebacterium aquatimens]